MRARHVHLIEAIGDTLLATVINASISYAYLHATGLPITIKNQVGLTSILLVCSIVRKYLTRRTSSNAIKRMYEQKDS